ncbi:hypothetical protein AKJ55_01945, partial [candidate division MSBL1 archaeon SCGC-AAA382M17]
MIFGGWSPGNGGKKAKGGRSAMTRNWKEYNEELVKRGEFYLSPHFLKNWDEELEEMNGGKVGRPYEYPESYVQFAALWYEFFHLPHRTVSGLMLYFSIIGRRASGQNLQSPLPVPWRPLLVCGLCRVSKSFT